MSVDAFRIQNFMGFVDSGWIEMRPLTLLFGRNSSGKSAILRALLLLQQSLNSPPHLGPLLFVDEEGLDFGGYREMVHNHEMERQITITFRHRFTVSDEAWFQELPLTPDEETYFIPEHEKKGEFSENRLVRALTELIDLQLSYGHANIVTLQTEISFFQSHRSGQAALKRLVIRDEVGDEVVGLTFVKEQNRWLVSSDFLRLKELEEKEWQSLDVVLSTGFFPKVQLAEEQFNPEDPQFRESQLSSSYGSYVSLLGILYLDMRNFLTITYLGPLRPAPQRFYYAAGQGRANRLRNRVVQAAIEAKQAASLHSELAQKYKRIQAWLKEALRTTFDVRPIGPTADGITADKHLYEIVFQEVSRKEESETKGIEAGIREVGSGLSQVLPVLIEALLAPKGTLVIIEQPELHLHPKAQADLGDLFIEATKYDIRLIIETHSEHLLLRLRRRIAESTIGEISTNDNLYARSNEVQAMFVDRSVQGVSSIESIDINEFGEMASPVSFKGFFSDDAREVAKLTAARLKGQMALGGNE